MLRRKMTENGIGGGKPLEKSAESALMPHNNHYFTAFSMP
jgi:hypothetical protein